MKELIEYLEREMYEISKVDKVNSDSIKSVSSRAIQELYKSDQEIINHIEKLKTNNYEYKSNN